MLTTAALDILLVDDDDPLRDMLSRSFEREGHKVTAVADCQAKYRYHNRLPQKRGKGSRGLGCRLADAFSTATWEQFLSRSTRCRTLLQVVVC